MPTHVSRQPPSGLIFDVPQNPMRTAALVVFLSFVTALHAASTTARALQQELHLDDSKWRLLNETPTSISWASDTGLAITLNVIPGLNASFPPPGDLDRMRSVYREEALSYQGGLVEAEPREVGGIYYNWVMMKFPLGMLQSPPDNRPGFGYQLNAVFPTTEGRYVLQVAAAEAGTTGIRESAGIIIFMKQEGVSDLAAAAKSFRRDPYDHAHDARALFNVCDERRYDSSFPQHPLTRCRAEMDRLLKSVVISDRIRRIAQFGAKEGPNKAPEPASTAITPPAAQEARRP